MMKLKNLGIRGKPRFGLTTPDQLAYALGNIETSLPLYRAIFGDFAVREASFSPTRVTYRAKPASASLSLAVTTSGQMDVELVEVKNGQAPTLEHLASHGEGMHHVRFPVADHDQAKREFEGAGFSELMDGWTPDGTKFSFLEGPAIFGHSVFELIEFGAATAPIRTSPDRTSDGLFGASSELTLHKRGLGPIDQIAFVVRDLPAALPHYSALFGEFDVWAATYDPARTTWNSVPVDAEILVALGSSGNVEIELIQPVRGNAPQGQHLDQHGEGLHHVRFTVDELEPRRIELEALGLTTAVSGRQSTLPGRIYMESPKLLGHSWIELRGR